jgi:hypothetical protein
MNISEGDISCGRNLAKGYPRLYIGCLKGVYTNHVFAVICNEQTDWVQLIKDGQMT